MAPCLTVVMDDNTQASGAIRVCVRVCAVPIRHVATWAQGMAPSLSTARAVTIATLAPPRSRSTRSQRLGRFGAVLSDCTQTPTATPQDQDRRQRAEYEQLKHLDAAYPGPCVSACFCSPVADSVCSAQCLPAASEDDARLQALPRQYRSAACGMWGVVHTYHP